MEYDFAVAKGNVKGQSSALTTQGVSHSVRGDYAKGIEYFSRAAEIDKQEEDTKGLASSLNNIGSNYWQMGDYEKASYFIGQSLELKRELGDKKGIANSLSNLGLVVLGAG